MTAINALPAKSLKLSLVIFKGLSSPRVWGFSVDHSSGNTRENEVNRTIGAVLISSSNNLEFHLGLVGNLIPPIFVNLDCYLVGIVGLT